VARGAIAAPVLRSASAEIRFASPTSCDVSLTVAIEGATDVEHRVEVADGNRIDAPVIEGASAGGPATDIGRTRAITIRQAQPRYTLRYAAALSADRAYRCPVWLPAVPADGRSRNVTIVVTLPDGASAAGTMPAFSWTGSRGEARVPHLPAVVIVPFAEAGASRPWDVSRVMDAVAIATLVVGSLFWLRRTRARRALAGSARAGAHG
jgi:hypothetical protein